MKLSVPVENPTVKVRINASGKRIIGCVELPGKVERISDLLNSPEPCIMVHSVEPGFLEKSQPGYIVMKEAVTYLEALEEPRQHTTALHCGRFIPVVGELKEPPEQQQIIAEIFVPYDETLFDVLNDSRAFISMRNVHFSNFVERYAFLAVNKKALILVKS